MDIILVAVKRIGLTGNLGSGKSTVAGILKELGAYVYDADRIIHSFYVKGHPVYEEVVDAFGREILDEEGNIDRKRLAGLVFSDRERLRMLERITHSRLYEFLEEEFKKLPEDSVAVVEATLLVEKGTYRNYDGLIVVYAPLEVCRERAIKKGMDPEDVDRRLASQMRPEEKAQYGDWVVDNSGSIEETRAQVEKIYRDIEKDP